MPYYSKCFFKFFCLCWFSSRIFISSSVNSSAFSIRLSKIGLLVMSLWDLSFLLFTISCFNIFFSWFFSFLNLYSVSSILSFISFDSCLIFSNFFILISFLVIKRDNIFCYPFQSFIIKIYKILFSIISDISFCINSIYSFLLHDVILYLWNNFLLLIFTILGWNNKYLLVNFTQYYILDLFFIIAYNDNDN